MRLLLALVVVFAACADDAPSPSVEPLPAAPPAAPPEVAPIAEDALLGGWACEEGIDPEIAFRREGDARVFAGYLHARPSHTGTWRVHEGTLTIETDDGMTYLFPYVTAEAERLVLEGPAVRWACTRIEGEG